MAEKIKIIDEDKSKSNALENDLRSLASVLDGERKKSMADEASIRRLEGELKKKT